MKLWSRYAGRLLFIAVLSLLPLISLADITDTGCDPAGGRICNPLTKANTIHEVITGFLEGAIKIGLPIIALAVIYCGFLFVKAQGNPESISKAKDALLWTIVGAGILLGSWAIAQVITETVKSLG